MGCRSSKHGRELEQACPSNDNTRGPSRPQSGVELHRHESQGRSQDSTATNPSALTSPTSTRSRISLNESAESSRLNEVEVDKVRELLYKYKQSKTMKKLRYSDRFSGVPESDRTSSASTFTDLSRLEPSLSVRAASLPTPAACAQEPDLSRCACAASCTAATSFPPTRRTLARVQSSRLFNSRVRMTYADLKEVLSDVDDQLFQFLYRVFDPDGVGHVDGDQFILAVGLIIRGENDVDKQIAACFYMFDTERHDRLDHDEFQAMIEATIGLKLRYLLDTEEGAKLFGVQLQQEYSSENLAFYQAAGNYKEAPDAERLELARAVCERFVVEGSDEQVNLPGHVVKQVDVRMKGCVAEGSTPPADLFDAAGKEIYMLMERDTYRRFMENPMLVESMVNDFFDAADKDKKGYITFEQYTAWVKAEPTVLTFFKDISKAASGMLAKVEPKERSRSRGRAHQPKPADGEADGATARGEAAAAAAP